MDFESLYKINNKGKVYQWNIKVVLLNDNTYDIITSHGEQNGNKVEHKRNINAGKANRTILQQAISEATSKYNAKKNKEGYTENLGNLDNISTSRIIRPMLAATFKAKKSGIIFPCAAQRKLDGLRMMVHKEGDKIILESRKGTIFENFDKLKVDLVKLFKNKPNGFYLDGELYCNELNFETISGISRKLQDTLTNEQLNTINKVKYHVYDCFNINNMDDIFIKRLKIINELPKVNMVEIVETIDIKSIEDIYKNHAKFVEEGYEGIMLRNYNSKYQLNKRSKDLQKFKEFMEEEFIIVGYHEGQGDEAGMVIWDCKTKNGDTFAVRPRGTREVKRELFKNGDKYIGKELTVIFQEYTEYGIPRFPVGKDIREGY
jgi:ATP-dependent DNA ligase